MDGSGDTDGSGGTDGPGGTDGSDGTDGSGGRGGNDGSGGRGGTDGSDGTDGSGGRSGTDDTGVGIGEGTSLRSMGVDRDGRYSVEGIPGHGVGKTAIVERNLDLILLSSCNGREMEKVVWVLV